MSSEKDEKKAQPQYEERDISNVPRSHFPDFAVFGLVGKILYDVGKWFFGRKRIPKCPEPDCGLPEAKVTDEGLSVCRSGHKWRAGK